MTPEQMRALAERNEQRCLPQIVQPDELARESAAALRAAADQLETVPSREQIAEAIWDAMPFEAQEAMLTTDADEAADAVLAILTADTAPQEKGALDAKLDAL